MRISKKLTVVLLIIVPWAMRYLGLDAWIPTPADVDAARQVVNELRQADTGEVPALAGVIYVLIQGWLDARRSRPA